MSPTWASISPRRPRLTARSRSLPHLYRGLVDAAWSAFAATGHGHDTILIGELAPAGDSHGVVNFNNMPPLRFLRALYCVGREPPSAAGNRRRGPRLSDHRRRLGPFP